MREGDEIGLWLNDDIIGISINGIISNTNPTD